MFSLFPPLSLSLSLVVCDRTAKQPIGLVWQLVTHISVTNSLPNCHDDTFLLSLLTQRRHLVSHDMLQTKAAFDRGLLDFAVDQVDVGI